MSSENNAGRERSGFRITRRQLGLVAVGLAGGAAIGGISLLGKNVWSSFFAKQSVIHTSSENASLALATKWIDPAQNGEVVGDIFVAKVDAKIISDSNDWAVSRVNVTLPSEDIPDAPVYPDNPTQGTWRLFPAQLQDNGEWHATIPFGQYDAPDGEKTLS